MCSVGPLEHCTQTHMLIGSLQAQYKLTVHTNDTRSWHPRKQYGCKFNINITRTEAHTWCCMVVCCFFRLNSSSSFLPRECFFRLVRFGGKMAFGVTRLIDFMHGTNFLARFVTENPYHSGVHNAHHRLRNSLLCLIHRDSHVISHNYWPKKLFPLSESTVSTDVFKKFGGKLHIYSTLDDNDWVICDGYLGSLDFADNSS